MLINDSPVLEDPHGIILQKNQVTRSGWVPGDVVEEEWEAIISSQHGNIEKIDPEPTASSFNNLFGIWFQKIPIMRSTTCFLRM